MFTFLKLSIGSRRDRVAKASLAPARTIEQGADDVASRRLFWRTLLDWLAGANAEEFVQLDKALDVFAPHLRPVAECMSEVICDKQATAVLPKGLVQALELSGWVELVRKASDASGRRAGPKPPMLA